MTDSPRKSLGLALICAALGFITAYRPLADMDFPWHLAMGEAVLENGPRIEAEPISYLEFERSVDMGAWLGEALFAWVHDLAGLEGLVFLIALTAAAIHFLCFLFAERITRDGAAAFLVTAVVAALSVQRWRGRPDIDSLLFFYLMLLFLEGSSGWRRRIQLALTTLVWVNVHPGAIVAPVLVLARAFGRKLPDATTLRDRGLDAFACLLVLPLTPRGPLETIELVRLTVETGPLVPEWLPLWDHPIASFPVAWLLVAAIALLYVWKRPFERLALDAMSFLMALRSVRLLYMAGPAAASALRGFARPRFRRILLLAGVVIFVAGPLANRYQWLQKTAARGDSPFVALYEVHYPVAAADFIERLGLEGRLFHPVAWGGYLGWRLAPRNRSAHDGRISLWGLERAEHMQDRATPKKREALREELGFEILVVAPGELRGSETVAGGGRWLPIHADPLAAVYLDTRGPHARENLARLDGR